MHSCYLSTARKCSKARVKLQFVFANAKKRVSSIYLENSTWTTQTHIHAPSRIRTCDPNVGAAEDSTWLRLLGY